jgi:hypothetical protein
MRRGAVVVAIACLANACGGGAAPRSSATAAPRTPAPRAPAPQTSFPIEGCPIDDAAACEVIASAATALAASRSADLLELSRPDRFDCEQLSADLFPGCAEGGDLRGHPIASAVPVFEVLPRPGYRSQLEAILGNVDPSFMDDHGGGAVEVLGVGTCGPEEIERRSYHLGMTMAVSDRGAPAERLLGSFEFINREGRWWIGLWYLDTFDGWEQVSPDPFATIACGNMEPWALSFAVDGTPLEPGRYAYDAFEPSMTFEIGPGWIGGHAHAEFFDIQREEGVLLGFARPGFVLGVEGEVEADGLDPETALRTIASIEELEAEPVAATSIDGRPAYELRFRTSESVSLFGGDEGTFTIEAGSNRLLSVDVDGALVLVVDDVWAEPRGSADALVQGVIDSIRFAAT